MSDLTRKFGQICEKELGDWSSWPGQRECPWPALSVAGGQPWAGLARSPGLPRLVECTDLQLLGEARKCSFGKQIK